MKQQWMTGPGHAVVACALSTVMLLAVCGGALAGSSPGAVGGASGVYERDWGTCASAVSAPARRWYLAEGCTAGGFQTWVLVQNPGTRPVDVTMELQTAQGARQGPSDTIPPLSRRTYNLADYVVSYEVSTSVSATGDVVCERAMYGPGRIWGTGATGVTQPAKTWYLAEGCTAGGVETWVLLQNPGATPANVRLTFQTTNGQVRGPTDTIPARTRRTYKLADYVTSYDVATTVTASAGVVCERAMYGDDREWATDSTGISTPSTTWYMSEGCTLPGFETWLLVQNPGDKPVYLTTHLLTDSGEVAGPSARLEAGSRTSFDLSGWAPDKSIAAVVSASGPVVAERAMYGDHRRWGSCSGGSQELSTRWYMAEGCTASGFETWVAVANPGDEPVDVSFQLQTDKGPVAGPSGTIEAHRRRTFDLSGSVTSYNVSSLLEATGPVACERSMYGVGTSRRMCAPVEAPLLYPFTRDGSAACGHWPAGSTDYPYFGAPREGGRLHAGVDIYPATGKGTPVRAVKDGTVIKTGLFYTRATGEQTYAILVDHGDFVANYGEVQPPESWVAPGAHLARGQVFASVSGTVQLHFEMYAPGTTSWSQWYGPQPANLIDPTNDMLELY